MNRVYWVISLILVTSLVVLLIAQAERDAAVIDAAVIADGYLAAMQKKGYSFLSSEELLRRRDRIATFTNKYLSQPLDKTTREAILDGIVRCINRLYSSDAGTVYYGNGFGSGGEEWMYLNDRDYFLTFQYHLWVALTRQPLASADVERRETQQNWMRQYLTNLPLRGIYEPVPQEGMRNDEVREWAMSELESAFADPMHLLSEPLPDDGFLKLQERFNQFSNGIVADFHDMVVAALTSRFISPEDPADRYGNTYKGQLPFDDTVVDLWGNGPSLHFASNADFRGKNGGLSQSSVFDAVRCVRMQANQSQISPGSTMDAWLVREGRGDLVLDGSTLVAVRGAKIANLPVMNWFDADKLSDDQLRATISNSGVEEISIKGLPTMNGRHSGDRTEGEFFIVVQTREEHLAIINLYAYEFKQLLFWCRPRV